MPGTFVPTDFVRDYPDREELAVVAVVWGVSLGFSIAAVIRAASQTYTHFRRTRKVTAYIAFVWLELISSTIIGGTAWGYIRGTIPPSFWYFAGTILMWCFQTHCILQIIINRIALISIKKAIISRLKWGVFIFVLLINISVACIWIPSRLQISQTYHDINNIWDRIEKVLLAIVDVGLNGYFIYLVRSTLISYGLTKYTVLYYFNIGMIIVSLSMDILIIGTMSLGNSFIYVFFHPLAYLVKLHIELYMAELIAKIVKAVGPNEVNSERLGVVSRPESWNPNIASPPQLAQSRRSLFRRSQLGGEFETSLDVMKQRNKGRPCEG
ncbi:hypothetical protein B0I35DRAFT_484742 [Stachybotrys elegans]|uniref:Integral membrane protein n=1 Tax=Stachybotrys elegans TaxID=80388 RepID=A0A8K0WJJ9_9HYPO|nr:hypothetical protein B0I35DRAFT_484742 [Stachybotrys elegans]